MIAFPKVMTAERRSTKLAQRPSDDTGDAWFASLGRESLNRAYRLATLLLGNVADAEDATQEALSRAWARRATLRDEQRSQAWFDRILVNVCRDQLRRRRSSVTTLHLGSIETASATDEISEVVSGEAVLRAMHTLDLEHRAVVALYYWADLSLDEIADRLAVPAGTVKSRLHYARGRMREALSRDPGR